MSLRSSMRDYDRESDRIAEREEQYYAEHGRYTDCAGCGDECNPSNVHADGRKFCDECWELSDDDEYGGLCESECRLYDFREKMQKQMTLPVTRHNTRLNFMRYAEKESRRNPVFNGDADATYQLFMRWFNEGFFKTRTLPTVIAETIERRNFVFQNREALASLVEAGLRDGSAPKRLRERCGAESILSRFADWCPNSWTDRAALDYLQALSSKIANL